MEHHSPPDEQLPPAERPATEAHPTPRTYRNVFLVLMALLAVTLVLAFVDFDRFLPGRGWNTALALTIAVVKAVLIILFFMHVRYSPRITWAFASAAFVWLGIMIVLTMGEYLARNHPPGANPRGEPRYLYEQQQSR